MKHANHHYQTAEIVGNHPFRIWGNSAAFAEDPGSHAAEILNDGGLEGINEDGV